MKVPGPGGRLEKGGLGKGREDRSDVSSLLFEVLRGDLHPEPGPVLDRTVQTGDALSDSAVVVLPDRALLVGLQPTPIRAAAFTQF